MNVFSFLMRHRPDPADERQRQKTEGLVRAEVGKIHQHVQSIQSAARVMKRMADAADVHAELANRALQEIMQDRRDGK